MASTKHTQSLPPIAPKYGMPKLSSLARGWDLEPSKLKMPTRGNYHPVASFFYIQKFRRAHFSGFDYTYRHEKQCTRLGHECDYSPRLSFRDDTLKVMERMQDVSISGNAVWDSSSSSPSEGSSGSTTSSMTDDTLPPFASLTTDIEREMKAECYRPGTYHVVVNPESFANLTDDSEDSYDELPCTKNATKPCHKRNISRSRPRSSTESTDPNVVILAKFEDSMALNTSYWKSIRSSPLTVTSRSKSPEDYEDSKLEGPNKPKHPIFIGSIGNLEDAKLLSHFRSVVWKHLVQGGLEHSHVHPSHVHMPGADIFEKEAANFLPLFHAMMAVSALSLSRQDPSKSIDSLQHYQQTLPFLQTSMRSHQDLSSDGIAAAEPGGSNLWSHHIQRLIRICYMRGAILQREPFPFVVWWICWIDLYALFSGAGTGDFVRNLLAHDMIPAALSQLYPIGDDGKSIIYPGEEHTLPVMLRLNRDTFILAIRLGILAADCRRDTVSQTFPDGSMGYSLLGRAAKEKRLFDIQQSFIQMWTTPRVSLFQQQVHQLPPRSKEVFQHLHEYSYTNMWPNQTAETGSLSALDIDQRISAILSIANEINSMGRYDLRFIIFPTFIAGVAATSPTHKMIALDILSSFETNEGVGRNVATARQLLQTVYQHQTNGYMRRGHAFDVDWLDIMTKQGLQMVNFGL
ncbi:hypothetical protein MGYG_04749 [Nannizzia gypsea CBS 118893]|uniref:Uncharacterized protein n=1 Tax=Arthroderma gypseum (strain ATCC MYA-4604 / CBS 118893) TaxID=535722 RepID=E4UWJ3_ARTGP|nr:hypothetical protein MGYG_04749 [Nannizzia gypsea CBS 118893]EFR01749.1 hypothetical protein MGYG_04749 [Nannizzia gypsea CBS 118893]